MSARLKTKVIITLFLIPFSQVHPIWTHTFRHSILLLTHSLLTPVHRTHILNHTVLVLPLNTTVPLHILIYPSIHILIHQLIIPTVVIHSSDLDTSLYTDRITMIYIIITFTNWWFTTMWFIDFQPRPTLPKLYWIHHFILTSINLISLLNNHPNPTILLIIITTNIDNLRTNNTYRFM